MSTTEHGGGAGSLAVRVRHLVEPLLGDLGLEIYDFELAAGVLRITLDRPGGVDLDTLAFATRVVSRELDHADPIPGRYTLEVTSPGLERALRTPLHFRRAVGSLVSLRTLPHVEGERRARGVLIEADDDGVVVRLDEGGERRLGYGDIERAHTVFEWAATPKPGARGKPGAKAKAKGSSRTQRKATAS